MELRCLRDFERISPLPLLHTTNGAAYHPRRCRPDTTVNLEERYKAVRGSGNKQGWVLRKGKSLIPSWKPEFYAVHGILGLKLAIFPSCLSGCRVALALLACASCSSQQIRIPSHAGWRLHFQFAAIAAFSRCFNQTPKQQQQTTGQSLVSVDDQGDATEVCALQLTNVKPVQPAVADRMHCLQLTTPTDKICIQAQGARDAEEWRQSIENEISRSIHGGCCACAVPVL